MTTSHETTLAETSKVKSNIENILGHIEKSQHAVLEYHEKESQLQSKMIKLSTKRKDSESKASDQLGRSSSSYIEKISVALAQLENDQDFVDKTSQERLDHHALLENSLGTLREEEHTLVTETQEVEKVYKLQQQRLSVLLEDISTVR